MMRRYFILIFSLCLCVVCNARVAGPWHGFISMGVQKLPIVFNISDVNGQYSATMDSPLQGAKGIPVTIAVVNDTVDITIPMIGAKYHGVRQQDDIKGSFEQNGFRFDLDLVAGEYIPPRPQTPQAPYPYTTQEVTFINPADGYELHGTLTLPMFYLKGGTKKFNAVVMVTGSGTQNRDEEIYGHKPFAVLAHHLTLNGIASLRYDDRGYGDSIADMSAVTTETFAADAKAAINYLRDNVDNLKNIGVLGHSEGGTIAFILAADGDADFVVSLAGAAAKGDEILMKQNERILTPQLGESLIETYLKGLRRTLDFMIDNPGVTEWQEFDATMADLKLPQALADNLKAIISSRNAWLDRFIAYDPAVAIEKISVPVFAANGTVDMQVDCDQNTAILRALLPANTLTEIKEYPGLNHLMQEAVTGLPGEYGEIEQTISPGLVMDIVKWVRELP